MNTSVDIEITYSPHRIQTANGDSGLIFGRRTGREYVNEMNVRASSVAPSSLNEQERSVDAVFTTEAPVRVWDYKSRSIIDEVLATDGGKFPEQLPLFDNHWADTSTQLGSGRSIRKEKGQHVGTLVFAKNAGDMIDKRWELVRQKHITDVSIGYSYSENDYVDIAPGKTAIIEGRSYTAGSRILRVVTNWRAREISITPIGADDAAKIRGATSAENATRNISQQDSAAHTGGIGEDERNGTQGKGMNKKLRSLLEKRGLRAEATEAEAWAFFRLLGGEGRTEADELVRSEKIEVPQARADSQGDGDETDETESPSSARGGQRTQPPTGGAAGNPDVTATRRAERQRVEYIRGFQGEVSDDLITRAINEEWTEEQVDTRFNREIIRSMRSQRVPSGSHSGSRNQNGNTQARVLQAAFLMRLGIEPNHQALASPLAMRLLGGQNCDANWIVSGARALVNDGNLTSEAEAIFERAYARRHVSMIDLCRGALDIEGISHSSWSNEEIIQRAVSTSVLSNIFTTSFNASMIQGFTAIPDTSAQITRPIDLPNFQNFDRIQMGKYSRLERRARGNTPIHGETDDRKESIRVYEYASKFLIDEQDFIDDRFGALNQITPQEMGEAAAQLQPDLVYGLILSNPTMGDTGALFNSTAVTTPGGHANLNTSTALTADNLAARRAAFDVKTLPSTGRLVGVTGSILLVPTALRSTARVLVNSQELRDTTSSTKYGTLNPNRDDFTVIAEARLNAGVVYPLTGGTVAGQPANWYLVDGQARYGIEVAYLSGRGRAPRSRRLPDGQLDGYAMGWSIDHVVGVAPVGFEGIEKNAA